jgi:uncharacterized protein (DUF924 family)
MQPSTPRWRSASSACTARCWRAGTTTGCRSRAVAWRASWYRGSARAFASDALALEAARHLVDQGWDRTLLPVERQFAYLPFEHSESLEDQERACTLCEALNAFPESADAHRYALAHRGIIRRFGRFPHRNAALGRESTPEELEFLKLPGSSF